MSNALVSKTWQSLKQRFFWEMINDVVIKYLDTREFIEQDLIERCNREGISIDEVIYFFSNSKGKTFLQTKHVVYQS